MDIEKFRKAIEEGRIEWRKHVLQRLAERTILQHDLIKVLLSGKVIEDYPENKPYPSSLFLGFSKGEPLHVVASFDKDNRLAYIITVYRPSDQSFESDFRTRKLR